MGPEASALAQAYCQQKMEGQALMVEKDLVTVSILERIQMVDLMWTKI